MANKKTELRIVNNETKKPKKRGTAVGSTHRKYPYPPSHMCPVAKEHWRKIVRELYSNDMLYSIDHSAIEIYCTTYAKWREAQTLADTAGLLVQTAMGGIVHNPAITLALKFSAQLSVQARALGLNPSGRSRIKISDNPRGKQEDGWDDFS